MPRMAKPPTDLRLEVLKQIRDAVAQRGRSPQPNDIGAAARRAVSEARRGDRPLPQLGWRTTRELPTSIVPIVAHRDDSGT